MNSTFVDWLVKSSGENKIDECEFWSAYLMYDLTHVKVPKSLRRNSDGRLGSAPLKNPEALRTFLGQYDFLFV